MAEANIVVCVGLEYPEGWSEAERNAERRHREEMARIQAVPTKAIRDEEFRRGVRIGRAEAEVTALDEQVLHAEVGPNDYEIWRDALGMATTLATAGGSDWSPRVLVENAEWFHERLERGMPAPPAPGCSHCGADSSMDHEEGCPNEPDTGSSD